MRIEPRMGGSSIDDDWEEFTSPSNGLRTLVLVGRTGNGKSATGNSILQKKAFISRRSTGSVTSTCEMHRTVLKDGQIINVIDTPGLFDVCAEPEFLGKEIVRCINMAKDGIHAVLLVISLQGRFSLEEKAAIGSLQTFFGNKITDYMVIVFTGGDELENDDVTLESYLAHDCVEPLKELLSLCGNRKVLFDNRTKDPVKKEEQIQELLSHVNTIVAANGGKPYIDEMFMELKNGAMKLQNETEEVKMSEKYSDEEISKLTGQMHLAYEDQLKRLTEMVESKLREATSRLEKQLAEEQVARLNAEKMALDAQMKSNDEILELRKSLEKAHQEAAELRELQQKHKCVIL